MSYLVYCTFDLKNASATDYQNAYSDLKKIGLNRVVQVSGGNYVIPTTSVMGEFKSTSVAAATEHVRDAVKSAFSARKLQSEIFVLGGGDWAWRGSGT